MILIHEVIKKKVPYARPGSNSIINFTIQTQIVNTFSKRSADVEILF